MASSTSLQSTKNGDLLQLCTQLQDRYLAETSPHVRKQKGQVFTPPAVCQFMAGLFSRLPAEFCLLDPGAGIGSLTAAVCQRYLRLRTHRRLEVHLFESDSSLLDLLEQTMSRCRQALHQAGHSFSCHIHTEDFVLASAAEIGQQKLLFSGDSLPHGECFDGVITNPPYFKVNKGSLHARVMDPIIHGQPNIYAFFLAIAAKKLRPDGELVAITPRSFCGGLYFREFRQWFFERMTLDRIHLFESRTDTFQESKVLQESVITRTRRRGTAATAVTLTRSIGRDLGDPLEEQELPTSTIVDNSCGQMAIRIPASSEDADVLQLAETWPHRFAELGLKISTGPVVMFRATEFLLETSDDLAGVPLLSAHNVKPFDTRWPIKKKKWPLAFLDCPDSQRQLVPSRNYVLLKRFSAKEERRRLTAGCYLATHQPHARIALENHLNYIYHAARELTDDEVFGIAALFNSALLDRYFRAISGNTQVNATEIRSMRFPDWARLASIGKQVRTMQGEVLTEKLESVVLAGLGIQGRLRRHLEEVSISFPMWSFSMNRETGCF